MLDQQSKSASTGNSHGPRSLKLDTSTYKGDEGEAVLRWFVEIDTAIAARDITDPERQVAYAMSRLAGRAKSWAYGMRLTDPACFPNLGAFKRDLRAAFEPPLTELRTRSQFFALSQGKRTILAYSQRARYLISCISEDPIDDRSQAVVFMQGLNPGPVRNEVYRQNPTTLEAAITLALQEDFSFVQSQYRSGYRPKAPGLSTPRPARHPPRAPPSTESTAEPMDLSAVTTTSRHGGRAKKPIDKSTITCRRCWVKGHFPSECRAPAPVPRPPHIPAPGGAGSKNP